MTSTSTTCDKQGTLFEEVPRRTRSQAGKLAKNKGRVFERTIVNLLREAGLSAERGWWQSNGGGRVPDVMLDGVWLELGHGSMNPVDKLKQAEAYVAENGYKVVPVAVTRQTGARTILVTMRLYGLGVMTKTTIGGDSQVVVWMTWEDFLVIYKSWKVAPVKSGFEGEIAT